MKRHIAIFCLAAALSAAGCSARSESYSWSQAPRADDRGFQAVMLGYTEAQDHLYVRMCLRNLTDRDVKFGTPTPAGNTAAWIVAKAEGRENTGVVKQEKYDSTAEENSWYYEKVTGEVVVRAHTSEYIEASFPFTPPIASKDAPWSVALKGAWSFGDAINLTIPMEPGSAVATAAKHG